ncbi:MAG TPA: squalene/phytoene synthase family protein [Thermohalobaculum sp.]|nr:squalene/phytoene synthase family protein [Thermohalobaculum sp.]
MRTGLEALAPLAPQPGVDPQQVVDAITARAKTSFATGMQVLTKPRRDAMRAIYAFARVIDDIADEDWPVAEKHRLLDDWCAEIGRLYDGRPVSAIGQALVGPVARYKLPRTEFLMLIEGMEMDANGPIVAPPITRLRAYTRRVAGAVGMLSMRVFGAWMGEQSERAALALGDAFQLTNILHDIEEDAAVGRLYLPREVLEAVGLPTDDPAAVARHPELWRACADVGRLARADFASARAAMAGHGRLALAPALLMTGVYEGYLGRMEGRGYRREGGRVALSRGAKLWRGLVCLASPIAPRDG